MSETVGGKNDGAALGAGSPPMNRTLPEPAADNKIDALLARWAQPMAKPAPISAGADGTITIPAPAFSSKNRCVGSRPGSRRVRGTLDGPFGLRSAPWGRAA
jgi:hypothetical protein